MYGAIGSPLLSCVIIIAWLCMRSHLLGARLKTMSMKELFLHIFLIVRILQEQRHALFKLGFFFNVVFATEVELLSLKQFLWVGLFPSVGT